jgi:hypothetical protein
MFNHTISSKKGLSLGLTLNRDLLKTPHKKRKIGVSDKNGNRIGLGAGENRIVPSGPPLR